MQTQTDGPLTITKFDSLGPYSNNAYLIADHDAGEALIVDMPAGSRAVLGAIGELKITAILLTHTHPDHWADYDLVKNATGAPVYCHPAEVIMPANKIDRPLSDGEEIAVGAGAIRALHTPGHTPGSTCYLAGRILFSGDVLFPGGPGPAPNRPPTSNKALHPSPSASTRSPTTPSSSPATGPTPPSPTPSANMPPSPRE